jgi:hypothetical protein
VLDARLADARRRVLLLGRPSRTLVRGDRRSGELRGGKRMPPAAPTASARAPTAAHPSGAYQ